MIWFRTAEVSRFANELLVYKWKGWDRNTTLILVTKIADVEVTTATLKWKWAGYFARMHTNRWAKSLTHLTYLTEEIAKEVNRDAGKWSDDLDV